MAKHIYEFKIKQVRDHWEIYVNGEFLCLTNSYVKAVKAVNEFYRVYK